MGFIGKLFGKEKSQPYVDAGMALTFKLTRSLNLTGWNEGLPNYTPEELAAIDSGFSNFQKIANKELGGEAVFHPDALPVIQRKLAGEALAELADSKWKYADEIPANWKECVSTYLKSWASHLAPMTLLSLGDLLVKVGCKNEAKETFQVLLRFPTYARTFFGENQDRGLADGVVTTAKEALRDLD